MPSYILKKQLVFRNKDENKDLFRVRSAGRIKTHLSYTDLRAWSLECEENRQYFLDIMRHAGVPKKASSNTNRTTVNTDKSGPAEVSNEMQNRDSQGVDTKSQSIQCELNKDKEKALEEALEILESAKHLLSESLDEQNHSSEPARSHETQMCSECSKRVTHLDGINEEHETEKFTKDASSSKRYSTNRNYRIATPYPRKDHTSINSCCHSSNSGGKTSENPKRVDRITLLGKVIRHDKTEISRIKKLLREEKEHCTVLQKQLHEEKMKKLNDHQGQHCQSESTRDTDPSAMSSNELQVIYPTIDTEDFLRSNSSSCSNLADDESIIGYFGCTCFIEDTKEDSDTILSLDLIRSYKKTQAHFSQENTNFKNQ